LNRCGSSTVPTAYNVNFQTLLFAALPVEFSRAFQALCIDYLPPIGIDVVHGGTLPTKDPWEMFECLGLLERYEASVTTGAYEHIERHVLETCSRKWEEPMYEQLEKWFFAYMRPWVLSVYGNGRFDDGKCLKTDK
jgi:anaphase-promoting complex subunit 2